MIQGVFIEIERVWILYRLRSNIPSLFKYSWRIRKKSQNQLLQNLDNTMHRMKMFEGVQYFVSNVHTEHQYKNWTQYIGRPAY